jgi:hypothetical protein
MDRREDGRQNHRRPRQAGQPGGEIVPPGADPETHSSIFERRGSGAPGNARATQNIVSYMGFCWTHPWLTAIEVGWRWLFGIPFLLFLWQQFQQILLRIPPDDAGLNRLNAQNPFASSVVLANAAGIYHSAFAALLPWLVPVSIVLWSIVSGLGRTLLLHRMNRLDPASDSAQPSGSILSKAPGMIVLQAIWITTQLAFFYLWDRGVAWAAETHITNSADPDLVGYLCWVIFLSLGLFTLWGFFSWRIGIAPLLITHENCSLGTAIARSFRLRKPLSSKLAEINLVLGIVKIALIVLAMVFCAAPLPFSDQFGPTFLNGLYCAIGAIYLVANDYFQVVRLKSFESLRRLYKSDKTHRHLLFASQEKISCYAALEHDFVLRILETERALITDESSLWDFADGDSLEPYYSKIREAYGVDVSDIERAILGNIFERISKHRIITRS